MPPHDQDQPAPRRVWVRPVLLLGTVTAVLVLAKVFGLAERLRGLQDWIQSLGAWGPAAFVGIYVVATVMAVPGTALTLIAGGLFGSVLGVICVSAGSTLGAAAAFLVARYFARDSVSHWLAGSERFKRLDAMTERYGGWMVAFARLVPLFPFNLLNYGFGLMRVRFWSYVFWSWLCMLPGTILYVVGGDAVVTGIREGRVPWTLVAIAAVGLVVLTVAGWLVKRKIFGNDGDHSENAHDEDDDGDGPAGGVERGTNGDTSRIGSSGAGAAPAR